MPFKCKQGLKRMGVFALGHAYDDPSLGPMLEKPKWMTLNHLIHYNNEIYKLRYFFMANRNDIGRHNPALYDAYDGVLFNTSAMRLQYLINHKNHPQHHLNRLLRRAIQLFKTQVYNYNLPVDDRYWLPVKLPLFLFGGDPAKVNTPAITNKTVPKSPTKPKHHPAKKKAKKQKMSKQKKKQLQGAQPYDPESPIHN